MPTASSPFTVFSPKPDYLLDTNLTMAPKIDFIDMGNLDL